jgi:hypothetical protein
LNRSTFEYSMDAWHSFLLSRVAEPISFGHQFESRVGNEFESQPCRVRGSGQRQLPHA